MVFFFRGGGELVFDLLFSKPSITSFAYFAGGILLVQFERDLYCGYYILELLNFLRFIFRKRDRQERQRVRERESQADSMLCSIPPPSDHDLS